VLSDRIDGFAVCGPNAAGSSFACKPGDLVDMWSVSAAAAPAPPPAPAPAPPPPPANQAPNGVITSPTGAVPLTAGQSVTFAANGSDPDGNVPLVYGWDFGGGAASSTIEDPGAVVFRNAGTFMVRLTVKDSLGLADPTPDTRTITVLPVSSSGR